MEKKAQNYTWNEYTSITVFNLMWCVVDHGLADVRFSAFVHITE